MAILARFINNEDGATAIEYALMASLIALFIIAAVQTVGTKVSTVFTEVGGALEMTAPAARTRTCHSRASGNPLGLPRESRIPLFAGPLIGQRSMRGRRKRRIDFPSRGLGTSWPTRSQNAGKPMPPKSPAASATRGSKRPSPPCRARISPVRRRGASARAASLARRPAHDPAASTTMFSSPSTPGAASTTASRRCTRSRSTRSR